MWLDRVNTASVLKCFARLIIGGGHFRIIKPRIIIAKRGAPSVASY